MPNTTKITSPLLFRVRALTNLHPGAGDSFYGPVDKMVQRDPASGRPVIHAHSLKGALREYFEQMDGQHENSAFIRHVFGSPVKGNNGDLQPGDYRFFSADLLALPVPDTDPDSSESYHLATDDAVWSDFFEKIKLLGRTDFADVPGLKKAFSPSLPRPFDASKSINFREVAEELPVVARNQLDNGKSENLWYEELLPRETIFGFVVQACYSVEKALHRQTFIDGLDGKVIQVGANATVGYGYCLFTCINPPKNG